jgi:hypothetical protein
MKPKEFMDCTYREAKLFAQSFFHNKELQLKEQIILFENITNKLLYNDPNIVKRPQKIKLVDLYKDLFKSDLKEMVDKGLMKPQTEEEQYQFVMELQKELKEGDGL